MNNRRQAVWAGLILPMVTTLFLFSSCAKSDNKVVNPGFESGSELNIDSWHAWAYVNTPTSFQGTLDRKGKSGNSAKLVNLVPNDSWFVQDIPVQGNHIYRVTGWIKTDNVITSQGPIGANICILKTAIRTTSIKGTQPWTFTEFYVKTSPQQTLIPLACRLGSSGSVVLGTAWFDDVQVLEANPPETDGIPVY